MRFGKQLEMDLGRNEQQVNVEGQIGHAEIDWETVKEMADALLGAEEQADIKMMLHSQYNLTSRDYHSSLAPSLIEATEAASFAVDVVNESAGPVAAWGAANAWVSFTAHNTQASIYGSQRAADELAAAVGEAAMRGIDMPEFPGFTDDELKRAVRGWVSTMRALDDAHNEPVTGFLSNPTVVHRALRRLNNEPPSKAA